MKKRITEGINEKSILAWILARGTLNFESKDRNKERQKCLKLHLRREKKIKIETIIRRV